MSKMCKSIVRFNLLVLVFNVIVAPCEGFRNKGDYESKYETRGYTELVSQKLSLSASKALDNLATNRGIGLSAWGIITVTISIILAIAGMYYFSICYPVLCQKQRKFDIMGESIESIV